MVALDMAAPTEVIRTLDNGLLPLDSDSDFWWRTTGYMLAHLLQQAGYNIHAQYACLLFYRTTIAPSLGARPNNAGRPSKWRSYTTDDFSPIEYSWNWGSHGTKPQIRFAIEAIGSETGSLIDPFNQSKSIEMISKLSAKTQPQIDLTLFNHLWDTLLVSSKDAALIDERASSNSHRSSLFIACELDNSSSMVKAYFMPMLRALETNQSRTQVVARSVRSLGETCFGLRYPALDTLIQFMERDPMGSQTEVEMVSVDCIDPKESRIKVYIRHPSTSWDSIRTMFTMNGQIKVSTDDLEELSQFRRFIFGLGHDLCDTDELPKVEHSTAGTLYCFYAKEGDKLPTPKLYLAAKHYGRNDQSIANGLGQYFGQRNKGEYVDKYKSVLEQISNHRSLETQRGIHTYIACRCTDSGLNVTSYLSPEIYHPARWTASSLPSSRQKNDYVFRRDFAASARLNYQHNLLKQHHGFLLHPSIELDAEGARIADIGTGTGVWPIEASRAIPNASFDGFDISSVQYPPNEWLPKNVSMHVQDIYEPFSADLVGKFDVVHIQKLITIVYNNDPAPLIQNVMGLLKPGGYIQWNEIDPASASVDTKALASGNASATQEMLGFMQSPEIARFMNWISDLPSILSGNGFEPLVYDRARINPADRAAWNIGFLLTYEDAMTKAERLGTTELKVVLDKLYGEMCQGSFVQPEIMLAVAKKL